MALDRFTSPGYDPVSQDSRRKHTYLMKRGRAIGRMERRGGKKSARPQKYSQVEINSKHVRVSLTSLFSNIFFNLSQPHCCPFKYHVYRDFFSEFFSFIFFLMIFQHRLIRHQRVLRYVTLFFERCLQNVLIFSDGLVGSRTDEQRESRHTPTGCGRGPTICGWMHNNKKCLMLGFRWALGPSPAGSERRSPVIAWARPPDTCPPPPVACALFFRGRFKWRDCCS